MTTDIKVVCLNAWTVDDDGNETYTDNPDTTKGWSVYLRIPDPRGDYYPFDCTDEQDFETYEAAIAFAEELAAQHGGCEIREY